MYGSESSKEGIREGQYDYDIKHCLLKIGDNNIPEGGIYLGYGKGNFNQVFSYYTWTNMAENEEVVKIANTFEDCIKYLKLFIDEETKGVYKEINMTDMKLSDINNITIYMAYQEI